MRTLERETELATAALNKLKEIDADMAQRFMQEEMDMDEEEVKFHGVTRERTAVDIRWDIDEDDEQVALPTEVEIPWDIYDDDIADYLSDEYGFCVSDYNVEEEEV